MAGNPRYLGGLLIFRDKNRIIRLDQPLPMKKAKTHAPLRRANHTDGAESYPPKFDFLSSHTMAIAAVPAGARVLDIGSGRGHIGGQLEKKGCHVTGVDGAFTAEEQLLQRYTKVDLNADPLPYPVDAFDVILLLDILEHLDPVARLRLLNEIRSQAKGEKPAIIITLPNVAFLLIRLQLLLGRFEYVEKGILDVNHRSLYTFRSARRLLSETGYRIRTVKGIPPPIPLVLGSSRLSRFLFGLSAVLTRILPTLFAYQIFITATPMPDTGKKGS